MMSGTYSKPPYSKEGYQKFSKTLAILLEFLVVSIFHETKTPIVDMKVQVYSKFRKKNFPKKMKSPLSVRNGRISTSKRRGKLQKMGCYIPTPPPPPKKPRPSLHARA
jgi:hypothetical protein